MVEPPISGQCDPSLRAVEAAFRENFVERGEVGAAVCVIRRGEVLVDLWGGWVDEARQRPWSSDTMVDIYSAGKAVVATLLLQQIDRGVIALDTPVADVWPEFAAHGKERVTIRRPLGPDPHSFGHFVTGGRSASPIRTPRSPSGA